MGAGHPELATQLSNRGEILNALGRFRDGRASFEKARIIWERELGLDNRILAYALTGIGVSYIAEGDPSSAIVPLERAARSATSTRVTRPAAPRRGSRWRARSGRRDATEAARGCWPSRPATATSRPS